MPGGKRESGESDAEALIREIQEELSVQLVKDSLHHIGTFTAQAHGHPQGVMVQMTCYTASYKGKLQAAAEIEEIVWLCYADKEKVTPVDKIIFDWLKEERRIR
ncbi:NUDIX hydrolase [Litoribacter populi]|uniref:NUDIX hydrolase n=1 Tax=Litoribacter populi TaxID=2598460 RepID=UPI001F237BF1|nr:NUDIX domain-containing protein [Litoribacter populi]